MAGRSIKRASFAATVARSDRRASGRTWAPKTPLAVRTADLVVDPELRDRILRRLGERLGKFAPHIERLTVRFEDVNGPRGGIDVVCRIKAVISGLPSLIVTERAGTAAQAFDRAGLRLERAVRRAIGRARERGHVTRPQAPELQPEFQRQPRRAPASRVAASTAARNRKGRAPKATVALEGSTRARPSRKSTRKSANRAKHGNKLARRERRRATSPKGRRARAASTR
jgi:ribosome-associated translation inhibitor RaiA